MIKIVETHKKQVLLKLDDTVDWEYLYVAMLGSAEYAVDAETEDAECS